MSRPLPIVIDAIKKQIPESFDQREELINKIDRTRDSALIATEEQTNLHWAALGSHLQNHLGELDTDWAQTIEGIMTATLDYNDYL